MNTDALGNITIPRLQTRISDYKAGKTLGKLQVALVLIPVRFRLCIRGVRGGERSLGTGESVGVHHSALKGANIRKDNFPTCAAEKRRLGYQGAGSTGFYTDNEN